MVMSVGLGSSIAVVPVDFVQPGCANPDSVSENNAVAAIESSPHVPYSATMASKSLLQHNPHLQNEQEYRRALRTNVLSSMAIEGVKKSAERALPLVRVKRPLKPVSCWPASLA